MFCNKKVYNMTIMVIFACAFLANLCALFFRDTLPDFWSGFLQGIALVGMLLGLIHVGRCMAQKKNPYTGENITK